MIIITGIKLVFNRFLSQLRYNHVQLAIGTKIHPGSSFGGYNKIEKNTTFYGKIGHDSYIGKDSYLYAEIGNYTSIGDNVKCVFSTHPVRDFVSTSPVFYSTARQNGHTYVNKQLFEEMLYQENKDVPVIIGSDVWIGSNVLLVGRITIHDGAVISAGSVVTQDVAPFSIVGGVPAKEIKKRFDDVSIKKLLSLKWWDQDERWIRKHADLFKNIDSFLKTQGKAR